MNEVKKLKIGVIILLILFAGSWLWFIVQDSKPKSVVDVVNTIVSEESTANMSYKQGADTQENIDLLLEYRNLTGYLHYNQYFVLDKGGEEVLLVETTPGLVDNALEIKSVKEINREIYENELHE
ncbi:hypothetical protein [Marinilactibacillus kalidii]|uniref:hypothetical protein n=1 Tax=Marinilactibacillus kalidii TaxID=2820274 RepID=UPI001ABEDDA0|nr:hypothetical protein [Marinilactibacillus kalidii]